MSTSKPQGYWSKVENDELKARAPLYYGYSVAVIANPQSRSLIEFASGVKMRIGKHLFVITARHCFQQCDGSIKPILILESNQQDINLNVQTTPVIKAVGHPSYPLDIGFLEISEDIRMSATTVDHISDEIPRTEPKQTEAGPTLLYFNIVGHPINDPLNLPLVQYLTTRRRTDEAAPSLVKRGIMTPCLDVSETHYRFAYPDDNVVTLDRSTLEAIPSSFPSTPHGFSGAGVWCGRRVEPGNNIILPERMVQLFAIQCGYMPDAKDRDLVAIPIKHCMRLIHIHYPDLRELLDTRFPSLPTLST